MRDFGYPDHRENWSCRNSLTTSALLAVFPALRIFQFLTPQT